MVRSPVARSPAAKRLNDRGSARMAATIGRAGTGGGVGPALR